MTPQAEKALSDPKFYQMTPEAQQRVLATYDPGYGKLSAPARSQVLQMGQQKLGSSPAAPAPADTTPAPDLTTNSIDPATGTGYGLYRMGSYDYNQGQVTKPEIQVPYNRVADAQAAGYNLHPDETPRYQNDTKHNGSLSRATGQVKSLLSRMTEPMPDRPLNGTPFQNAATALTNVGQLPFNVVNRTVRGVAGLPQGTAQGAVDFTHGNPEGFDPAAMAENSYKGLQQDTADLGPMAALGNLGGDAATMYAAGKLGGKMSEVGDAAVEGAKNASQSAVRRLAGSGLGVARDLVRKTEDTNELITKSNAEKQAAAQDAWEEKQAKALTDHQAELLRLKQKYAQDTRNAAEKARIGSAEDQKTYWDKRRAAKQAYDQAVKDQVDKYTTERAKAQQENTALENMLDLRRKAEQKVQQATDEYYAKNAAADVRSKAEENSAWSSVWKKLTGKTIDGGQIVEPLKRIAAISPETVQFLRKLQVPPENAPLDSLYAQERAAIMKAQGYHAPYESFPGPMRAQFDKLAADSGFEPDPIDFDPQAGKPIPVEQVHRASSILQGYIRDGRFSNNGPLLGEMKQLAKALRASVTRAAAEVGATADLDTARNTTVIRKGAFGKKPYSQATTRTDLESRANPDADTLREEEEELARTYRYDPTLVDSFRQVKAARQALSKLSEEEQLRERLQRVPSVTDYPAPPKPPPVEAKMPPPLRAENLPLPPIMPEAERVPFKEPKLTPQENISGDDIRRANDKGVREGMHTLAGRMFWWGTGWPIFRALSEAVKGQKVSASGLLIVPASGALSAAVNAALSHPAIMDFFTRPTRQQIATIPLELRGQMPEIVAAVRSRGVLVDPLVAAYAASIQGNRAQQSAQMQGAPQ